jgi:hypothetical protein
MKFLLSSEDYPIRNYVVKNTQKAVLVSLIDDGEQKQYWVPKSQAKIEKKDVIRVIDGKPKIVGQQFVLEITDWWWARRQPAKPMGLSKK